MASTGTGNTRSVEFLFILCNVATSRLVLLRLLPEVISDQFLMCKLVHWGCLSSFTSEIQRWRLIDEHVLQPTVLLHEEQFVWACEVW